MHHIRFQQDEGVAGSAQAVGALVGAMPNVVAELAATDRRLVRIVKPDPRRRRHETVDSVVDPPRYWR